MKKYILIILMIMTNCFSLMGCANNPVSQEQQFMVISEEDELKIGKEADLVIKERFGTYLDPILSGYIDRIGQNIAAHSDRPGIPYSFAILDTDMENAFALPGGYVYITRGLLARLNSEAELANVLAHEITHVAARHGVQQMSQAYGYQLAWISAGILLQQQNINRWKELADIGVQLVLLGYSREHELESDSMGIRYAYAAGYDPRGMASFLGSLDQEDRYRELPPEWLSTHPATTERIARLQKEAADIIQADSTTSLIIKADQYKSMIAGIALGPGGKSGIIHGRQYKNQHFGFRVTAPKNWTISQKTPSALVSFTSPHKNDTVYIQAMITPTPMTPATWRKQLEQGLGDTRIIRSEELLTSPLNGISVLYGTTEDSKSMLERRDFMTSDRAAYTLTYVSGPNSTPSTNERFTEICHSFTLLTKEEMQRGYTDYLLIYTVAAGDTPETIAAAYVPLRAKDIIEYNGLSSTVTLSVGEKLKIPPRKRS